MVHGDEVEIVEGYRIGCVFTPDQGWRAKECVEATNLMLGVSQFKGLLWVKSAKPIAPGRFVNPKKLIARQGNL